MKQRTKRIFLMFIVLLLVSGLFSVSTAGAEEDRVLTVNASYSSGNIAVNGTTTPGALAVALMVYDNDMTELLRLETTEVKSDSTFNAVIKISLNNGTYNLVAADYEGGPFKSISFKVVKSSSTGSGGGGGSGPLPTQTVTVDTEINPQTKTALANLDSLDLAASKEGNTLVILKPAPGVLTYATGIPVASLEGSASNSLTINTEFANIKLPTNMLSGLDMKGRAEISIGQGDKTKLPEDIRQSIGDRPLIQLNLSIDGQKTPWENPDAPVTVTIPNYKPTALELENPESIVVWYIDGSGNAISVANCSYDPETGLVSFKVKHFSDYALVYNKVNFDDVINNNWFYKPVSFIAARDITKGTEANKFSPENKLTRGEFIVLMMRAYDITPHLNIEENFSDAGNTYYTSYLATARKLGITAGIGDNLYAPNKEITRQETFTLLYNALNVIKELPQGKSGKLLSDFTDEDQIDSWANTAMNQMVESGIVSGSNGKLAPLNTITRAEMAQVLYNLLSQ